MLLSSTDREKHATVSTIGKAEMKMPLKCGTKLWVNGLACAFILQNLVTPGYAQTVPTALNIDVVEGEGARARVRQRAGRDPAIRVQDESQKPVAGAAVVFTLPTEGATGVFGNGARTLTVLTDASGTASAQGLRFNQVPGKVQIHVNVSYKGLTARTNITQFSEAPAGYKIGGGHGKLAALLVMLAAGGAGGAYYATRSNGTTAPPATVTPSAPTPIGISAGTGSISPPR